MNSQFPWLTPDVSRMMASLTAPPMDLQAVTEAQRKNMEMLSTVCMLVLDSIHETARRQSALLAETLDQLFAAARGAAGNGGADGMAAQRVLFSRGGETMREIADLIAKSNGEAMEVVGQRTKTCLDELNTWAAAMKPNGRG
ncbi:MAG: hypothetical protein FJX36_09820 [Alphaproteobacteria bacterium]|nr:hypothetical protein [Alphaproteobacteria bacterium]